MDDEEDRKLEAALGLDPGVLGGEAARAASRLEAAAGTAGLLDVAYAAVDSPMGELLVAVTARGLARIAYPGEPTPGVLDDLARQLSPRMLESPRSIDSVRRQLDEYFGGRRREFDLAVDWTVVGGFARRVLRAATRIPFGEVRTYAQVAAGAGNPRAARATGNALGSNPVPIVVPCHRVVRTGGALGGYTGGLDRKALLLQVEGWPDR